MGLDRPKLLSRTTLCLSIAAMLGSNCVTAAPAIAAWDPLFRTGQYFGAGLHEVYTRKRWRFYRKMNARSFISESSSISDMTRSRTCWVVRAPTLPGWRFSGRCTNWPTPWGIGSGRSRARRPPSARGVHHRRRTGGTGHPAWGSDPALPRRFALTSAMRCSSRRRHAPRCP